MNAPGERKHRCRYLRRDGNRCQNEIAGSAEDDVLLCPKHLLEAYQQMAAHIKQTRQQHLRRDEKGGDARRRKGGQS